MTSREEIEGTIALVLSEMRGYIQQDGGDVEFVSYEAGIVKIRLRGACIGCPSSFFTVKFGIEEALKQRVPDVQEVMLVEAE